MVERSATNQEQGHYTQLHDIQRSINRIDKMLRPESNPRKNAGSRKGKPVIHQAPQPSQQTQMPLRDALVQQTIS